MYNYLNKPGKDDYKSNSCKLVADWLIVLLLLFRGDEYQGHVTQVEVIDYKIDYLNNWFRANFCQIFK